MNQRSTCLTALAMCVVSLGYACGDDDEAEARPRRHSQRTALDAATEVAQDAAEAEPQDAATPRDAAVPPAARPAADGGTSTGPGRPIKIRFKAKINGEDFACGRTYRGVGSPQVSVTPSDLRFFVQDVRLYDAKGKAVPVMLAERSPWQVPSVALLDFADQTGACNHGTAETNTEIVGTVPEGDYHGLSFVNGVPEELNHEDPLKHPPPLQATDLTWGWLTGFKFFVAELKHVADPDSDAGGVDAFGGGLLHVGSAACTVIGSATTCRRPNRNLIRFLNFDPSKNVIAIDIGVLFTTTDLTQDLQCHSDIDACEPLFASVGVAWSSGASGTNQIVFRVE